MKRQPYLLLFPILFFALIEYYAFQAIRVLFQSQKFVIWAYLAISILIFLYIILTIFSLSDRLDTAKIHRLVFIMVLVYVTKGFIAFGLILEDIYRFMQWGAERLIYNNADLPIASRRKFISTAAVAVAAIPFLGIIHGVLFGRYNYRVIKKTLKFPDLPAAFDGFRIVQISDVHSGSFDNEKKVGYGIDLINSQKGDVVFFTGDLVNNVASEMKPWIPLFSKIEAKEGKFSILGNHDYGDYVSWPSKEAKQANLDELIHIHKEIGFDLMNNRHLRLERNGESIVIAGVENWGDPPFPQYGDLNKTMEGVKEDDFCVLMSHDPTHYDREVVPLKKKIHLTLSGHTHGMQFGIEIPGLFKWSPVKFKYPKWAGLYETEGKYLYVNRGFGYIAFPGRVGMWPEVTVIELKREEVG